MPRLVMKFGGTSLAGLERIRGAAATVKREVERGFEVAVVVSAMAGATNQLVAWVREAASAPGAPGRGLHDAREYDTVVASGEQVTSGLLALALQQIDVPARSWQGWQVPIRTSGAHGAARIMEIETANLERKFAEGLHAVVSGFQGIGPDGRIATLGRGGSDTSAIALAAALSADVCEILTDVDGVYTTDPRIEPRARKIPRITYEEMLELASLGAKVLQIRSVEFAMKFGVPVHVRSSLNDSEGTWIVSEQKSLESAVVTGVALDRNEAKVTLTNVPDVPGTIASIFGALAGADIVVDMIIQNASRGGSTDVTFTVPENDLKKAVAGLRSLDLPGAGPMEILSDPDICKISIVGVGMRTHAGVASKAFEILARENINIQMVSTSEIKVSVVVHERYGELALRALHAGFGLHEGPTSSAA
jgi:aspartate kinase